jgi:hypothetical protein
VKPVEAAVALCDEQRGSRHNCSVSLVTWSGWGRQGGGAAGPAEGSGPAMGQGWAG